MKNKFSAFLSIFAFSFLFSSCEFLFPELINQDKTTIIGDNYVYAGSTIRLTPVIEAPNYQGRKVDITVLSSDDKIAEAYFTSSCTGYEFIVEGVKSGEIDVKFIVKDYFTKNLHKLKPFFNFWSSKKRT